MGLIHRPQRPEQSIMKPAVDPTLLLDLHTVGWRHWTRLGVFVLLYAAAGYAVFRIAEAFPGSGLVFICCLPLYVVAAASLHGMAMRCRRDGCR